MLQKAWEYLIDTMKICCRYFFNWDEYIIQQVLVSILLVLLYCKSASAAIVSGILYIGANLKDLFMHMRDQQTAMRMQLKHRQ
ncbi:MAG: hypothetical protein JSS82_15200 [Bacteroidetes bacterium]|nr:hypothetical protein [Bacteroidota bacterium]